MGGNYQLLQVEPPEVLEEEICSAVRWQVKDLLNYELEEAGYSMFFWFPRPGSGKNRIAFVVASPKETILGQVGLFREARLEVGAVDIPENGVEEYRLAASRISGRVGISLSSEKKAA